MTRHRWTTATSPQRLPSFARPRSSASTRFAADVASWRNGRCIPWNVRDRHAGASVLIVDDSTFEGLYRSFPIVLHCVAGGPFGIRPRGVRSILGRIRTATACRRRRRQVGEATDEVSPKGNGAALGLRGVARHRRRMLRLCSVTARPSRVDRGVGSS